MLQATLHELEETAKRAFRSNPSASSDEASAMLALLNVAGALQTCVATVEGLLRDSLQHLQMVLHPQAGQQNPFSLVDIRFNKSEVRPVSVPLLRA